MDWKEARKKVLIRKVKAGCNSQESFIYLFLLFLVPLPPPTFGEHEQGVNTSGGFDVQYFICSITHSWPQPWEAETTIISILRKKIKPRSIELTPVLMFFYYKLLRAHDLTEGTYFCNRSSPAEPLHAGRHRSQPQKEESLFSLLNFCEHDTYCRGSWST